MYSWHDIARRTEEVYNGIAAAPVALRMRLPRYLRVGPISGLICVLIVALDTLLWWLLEWLHPAASIEPAAELPRFPGSSACAGTAEPQASPLPVKARTK